MFRKDNGHYEMQITETVSELMY